MLPFAPASTRTDLTSIARRGGCGAALAFLLAFGWAAHAAYNPTPDTANRVWKGRESRYIGVDISDVANSELDWLQNHPHGDVRFDGIPFNILAGDRAVVRTRNRARRDYPQSFRIRIGLASVARVHLLLNGTSISGPGQRVGTVRIAYADGASREIDLVALQTIRETWIPDADLLRRPSPRPPEGVTWRVAYLEHQMRGTMPALAFLDRLSIATDPARRVAEISFRNAETPPGSGIVLTAATVEIASRAAARQLEAVPRHQRCSAPPRSGDAARTPMQRAAAHG